jgi:hypothetical protein
MYSIHQISSSYTRLWETVVVVLKQKMSKSICRIVSIIQFIRDIIKWMVDTFPYNRAPKSVPPPVLTMNTYAVFDKLYKDKWFYNSYIVRK